MMDDDALLNHVADAFSALPGVLGVALGGSRAYGGTTAGSDWDVAIYYRDGFHPDSVRALGWPGDISEIGGWGPVFNGEASSRSTVVTSMSTTATSTSSTASTRRRSGVSTTSNRSCSTRPACRATSSSPNSD